MSLSPRARVWLMGIALALAVLCAGGALLFSVTKNTNTAQEAQSKAKVAGKGAVKAGKKAEQAQDLSKATVRYLQGKQGPPGLGKVGAPGDKGALGRTGSRGPRGFGGNTGVNGDEGATGDQGAVGDVGGQGPPGENGAQGPAGDTGVQGGQGDQGPQGPQGDAGPQGPSGADGATGPPGPIVPCADLDPLLGYVCSPVP